MRLIVDNLSVSIGNKKPIDNISFDVDTNEVLSIIGQSGSGKSLTALSIMGLLDPAVFNINGKIVFDGVDILKLPEKKRKSLCLDNIAMIYQNPFNSLMPVERIKKQIIRMYGIKKLKPDFDKICELLEYTGLNPEIIINKYPHELSGGELQRVIIAMSMALDPSVLICDEPTTALDQKTGKQIISLLKKIKEEQGLSVLFISHDLSVVEEIADRIAIMKSGKIVEIGDSEEIFNNPKHDYVKELLEVARLER